ncbi:MAG: hypothetical protein U0903_16585 [Planctomycetales bacterium]
MDSSNLEDSKSLSPQEKASIQYNLEKPPLQTGRIESDPIAQIHDVHIWSGRALVMILILMLLMLGLATNYLAGGVVTWYVEKCLEIISGTK